jgi:hypothetical protein
LNATSIVHIAPGASVLTQVVETTMKPAEAVILTPVAVADDESLVTVTVLGGVLVVPTATVPKSSDLGLAVSFAGLAASAVPDPISASRRMRPRTWVANTDNLDRIMVGSSSDKSKKQSALKTPPLLHPSETKNRSP